MAVRLSVVTPSLDQAAYLPAAIESVLGQGVPVEYIVQDGGSRDGSLGILQSHSRDLRFSSQRDAGQASAVNQGFRAAGGDVLGWLNSDDLYERGAFAAALQAFDADAGLELVYGEALHVDAAGAALGPYPTEDWDCARLALSCYLCQPTVFLRRGVLERFGLLDERLCYCMDYEYWLRLGALVRVRRLPVRLARSRVHAQAKTVRARVAAHAEINGMLRRRLGHVPTRWIHNYAFAVVDAAGYDREQPRQYVWRLLWTTAWAFVRWQHRLPREFAAVTRHWLARAYARDAPAGPR